MAGLIQGIKDKISGRQKQPKDAVDSTFASLSWEKKLSSLYKEYRTEDKAEKRTIFDKRWNLVAVVKALANSRTLTR